MAPWPVFIIGESERRWLALFLLLFNAVELAIGVAVASQASNGVLRAALALQGTEGDTFAAGLLTTAAVLRVLVHAPGVVMAYDCIWIRRRERWVDGMHCWWFLFLSTYGAAAMCSFLVVAHSWDTMATVGSWLPLALDRAATHVHMRSLVESMQSKLQCCGDSDFRDWETRPWQPNRGLAAFIDEDYPKGDLVPFSCCDRFFPGPCIRQAVNGSTMLMRRTIYQRGCREVIKESMDFSLTIMIVLQSTSTFVQLMILVVARFLQTSMNSSQYQEKPTAPSPCWLFNNGLLVWGEEYPSEDAAYVQQLLEESKLAMTKRKCDEGVVTKLILRLLQSQQDACLNKLAKAKVEEEKIDAEEQRKRQVRAKLVRRVVTGKSKVQVIRELPTKNDKRSFCRK